MSEYEWFQVPFIRNCYVSKCGKVSSDVYGNIRILKTAPRGKKLKYERVCITRGGHKYNYYVHKIIANTFLGDTPKGMEIHHIDGDSLNNNLSNLKFVTSRENNQNRKIKGKYMMGTFIRPNGRFQAGICINGKRVCLGTYDTEQEAHMVYMKEAEKQEKAAALIAAKMGDE